MVKILDGRALRDKILEELKEKIKKTTEKYGREPGLATVLVGESDASKTYVGMKIKTCKSIGMYSLSVELPGDISKDGLMKEIEKINNNPKIDGILLQLPFPGNLKKSTNEILQKIAPDKDVDGLTPNTAGRVIFGDEIFGACTPKGIIRLLERYDVPIEGKEVVIVNRSNIIGKPLAMMFLRKDRNGTVTMCHTKTADIDFHLKRADILVSGVGVPNFITADKIKDGVVILDAGFNRTAEGKPCGDVDFEGVKNKCSAITPSPGGVGPMTIAMLMENTYLSFMERMKKHKN